MALLPQHFVCTLDGDPTTSSTAASSMRELQDSSGIFGVEQQVLACDCAGLDAPVVATGLLGVDFRQVFASDVNPNAVKWLEALGHAEVLHGDILERPISMPPDGVDGYVAGFPCQPFSRQGSCIDSRCESRLAATVPTVPIYTPSLAQHLCKRKDGLLPTDQEQADRGSENSGQEVRARREEAQVSRVLGSLFSRLYTVNLKATYYGGLAVESLKWQPLTAGKDVHKKKLCLRALLTFGPSIRSLLSPYHNAYGGPQCSSHHHAGSPTVKPRKMDRLRPRSACADAVARTFHPPQTLAPSGTPGSRYSTRYGRCGSPALASRQSRRAQEGRKLCHEAARQSGDGGQDRRPSGETSPATLPTGCPTEEPRWAEAVRPQDEDVPGAELLEEILGARGMEDLTSAQIDGLRWF
eukprot:s1737_g2.t1